MDKVAEAAANYGLLGLVLLAVAAGAWGMWRWTSVNVFKLVVDNYVEKSKADTKRQDALAASQIQLNERMAVFMNVMANHATVEERRMLEVVDTQRQLVKTADQLAETQQRLVLQKDSFELVVSDLRAIKSKGGAS